jgi:hypothetical protein
VGRLAASDKIWSSDMFKRSVRVLECLHNFKLLHTQLFYLIHNMPPIGSMFREGFPPKATFSVDDIPDLSGKVIIVTGANTGAILLSFDSDNSYSNFKSMCRKGDCKGMPVQTSRLG